MLLFDRVVGYLARIGWIVPERDVTRGAWPQITLPLLPSQEKPSIVLARTTGHDGRYIRGKTSIDRWFIDEASYVRNPDVVFRQAIPATMFATGGQLNMIGTPFGHNHFEIEYLKAFDMSAADVASQKAVGSSVSKDRRYFSCHATTWDNAQNLDEDELQAILLEDPMTIKQEYLGLFLDEVGAVFPWDRLFACAVDPWEFPSLFPKGPLQGRVYRAGIDWGQSQDYTVCTISDITEYPYARVARYRINQNDWDKMMGESAKLVVKWKCGELEHDATFSKKAGGQMRSILKAMGSNCRVIDHEYTNDSKNAMIENFQALIINNQYWFDASDRNFIDEMQFFKKEKTESGLRKRYNAEKGHHDDEVNAAALSVNRKNPASKVFQPPRRVRTAEELVVTMYQRLTRKTKSRLPSDVY